MDWIEIVGYLGSFLSAITFFPQVYKTWKTKSVGDLSLSMILIVFTSTMVWIVYGVARNIGPVIACNSIMLVLVGCLIYFKLTFKKLTNAQLSMNTAVSKYGFLVLLFFTINAQAQRAPTISDTLKSMVTQNILEYRMLFNPETNRDSIKLLGLEHGGAMFKNPYKVLFKNRIDQRWKLVLEVTPWPEDKPYKNFYLLRKQGNKFTNRIDTVSFQEYDHLNIYFPHDERFLVYYDSAKNNIAYLSGNFRTNIASSKWSPQTQEIGAILYSWRALAKYNAARPEKLLENEPNKKFVYDSLIKWDPEYYYLQTRKSTLASCYLMIKIQQNWPYEKFEIIYYTNKNELTKKENAKELYEVKYVFDYSSGLFPETYEQAKPQITKLSAAEFSTLQKKFGNALVLFFEGDLKNSVFNTDKSAKP